jgi:hypothetical protein
MAYILCSCTAQKKEVPLLELDIKQSTATTQQEQINIWKENLGSYKKKQRQNKKLGVPAKEMYLGSIWTPIRKMLTHPSIEGGLVMSAGLGLIDFDDRIPSYASTFVDGDSDSILGAGNLSTCRNWWYELESRSFFQDWLQQHSHPKIISILPQSYLHIAEELLENFVKKYGEKNLLLLAPNVHSQKLRACWVKTDSKMTHIVGGKMGDVSVRVLSWILQEKHPSKKVSFELITNECQKLLEQTRHLEPILKVGEKQSDEEITQWLSHLFQNQPDISRTLAHKKLREEGFACSTSRFKKIFSTRMSVQQLSLFPPQQK